MGGWARMLSVLQQQTLPVVLAALVVLLGLIVVLGWFINAPLLIQLHPLFGSHAV